MNQTSQKAMMLLGMGVLLLLALMLPSSGQSQVKKVNKNGRSKATTTARKAEFRATYNKLPLHFQANKGQSDAQGYRIKNAGKRGG